MDPTGMLSRESRHCGASQILQIQLGKVVGTGQLRLEAAHRRAQLDQRGRVSRTLLEQL